MLLTYVMLLDVSIATSSGMPPNIVLIIADDLGWNDVGWNNPDMITPNMNKLAKKGVILDNLYVQSVCSPTRAAVLTGYYPYHLGLQHFTVSQDFPNYIPENIPVLAEKFRELNYKTHLVGKWHLGNCDVKYTPTRRGFDSFMGFYTGAIDYYNRTVPPRVRFEEILGKYDFRRGTRVYFPPEEYVTRIFGRRAVDIISKHDRQQPLFLELAFSSPHWPMQVPREFENLYKCVIDKDRRTFSGMVTAMDVEIGNVVKALEKHNLMDNTLIVFLSDRIFGRRAVEIISKHDRQQPLFLELAFNSPHSPLQVPQEFENLYKCVIDKDRRIFSGMVTAMDVEIGNVVKALEKHKLMENTLIFFMSDNGGLVASAGNNLPFRGSKYTLWEGATKSAAFVYSKTLLQKRGYRSSKIMHAVDLFPTLLAVAGGTPDPKIDGKNQWPALSLDAESARKEFVYNIDEIDNNAAIRVGDLKLIVGPPSTTGNDDVYQLQPHSCRYRPKRHWSSKLNQHRHSYMHNNKIATEGSGGNQNKRRPTVDNCGRGGHTVMYRLYNITGDPEEKFNLVCHFPELLQLMKDRLDYYNKSYVTAQEYTNTEDFGTPYINDVISHRWC